MLVNMLEAKTQLSKLVEAALRGEEVIIANRGKPVVRLVKAEAKKPKRQLGSLEGFWSEAELDAAFSAEADAEVAADLAQHVHQRELRVMEPVAPYGQALKPARKTAKTSATTSAKKVSRKP